MVHSSQALVIPTEQAQRPVLAYSVQASEQGCVRFARSSAQARREGASELDTEWEGIETCRRAPQFDHFAPGPVPEKALWDAGWRFLCGECEGVANHWNDGEPVCEECAPAADKARTASAVGTSKASETHD